MSHHHIAAAIPSSVNFYGDSRLGSKYQSIISLFKYSILFVLGCIILSRLDRSGDGLRSFVQFLWKYLNSSNPLMDYLIMQNDRFVGNSHNHNQNQLFGELIFDPGDRFQTFNSMALCLITFFGLGFVGLLS
ncbi:hypothetical protein PACTADRAFT_48902 [Pachysolen tannophilus NRRL Y-2460]|uniref:Uncharacterized protein n=1 Tax=Pachysolen tannophilus NRRL Y-2460 TaxID=669874 RepID=A0A1E4TZH9_PACTA|nr:hypothetical protein PACTADRAFT_48902 [Pachysolen tannophilus NRRL Y-2460]